MTFLARTFLLFNKYSVEPTMWQALCWVQHGAQSRYRIPSPGAFCLLVELGVLQANTRANVERQKCRKCSEHCVLFPLENQALESLDITFQCLSPAVLPNLPPTAVPRVSICYPPSLEFQYGPHIAPEHWRNTFLPSFWAIPGMY